MTPVDPARGRACFDGAAEAYDEVRPSYPDAAIEDVLAQSGARRALEIGAGTGQATIPFAQRGLDIVALEPGARLAARLRERVRGLRVEVVESLFEDCALTGFDLVYAATSFHWVAPAVRYVRAAAALAPGGSLALLMNEKAAMDPGVRAGFSAAYAKWLGWPPWSPKPLEETAATWVGEITASGRFGPVHVGRFPWTTRYTSAQYLALLDTYSDHALAPDDRRLPLYDDLRGVIERHGGAVEIPYVTLTFSSRRI
jgi:SAM-dependent methyltransferase